MESKARIEKLKSFGWVGEFVMDKMYDPTNLPEVLYARYWSEQSKAHQTTPNTETINNYLRAYMSYALGNRDSGDKAIEDLYQINETYGPVAGSEGELVGAMGLMLLSDDASVIRGLDTLQDCETFSCLRQSVFAPYKYVGMQIAIAEGYARLGDSQKMEMAFDAARAYAAQNNHPYPELIEYLYQELTKEDGVIERWNTFPNLAIGHIKLPLPPSTYIQACQVCHASGRQTRQVYGDGALIEQ